MSNSSPTSYLRSITDDFGVWQHSINGEIVLSQGYALDDAARGLIVYLLYKEYDYANICLEYIKKSYSYDKVVGVFDTEKIPEIDASEDAQSLAHMAIAYSIDMNFNVEVSQKLLKLVYKKNKRTWPHIRSIGYDIIGYLKTKNYEQASLLVIELINKFNYSNNWFENKLTYANAVPVWALAEYVKVYKDITKTNEKYEKSVQLKAIVDFEKVEDVLKKSLSTIEKYSYIGAIPSPIGNRVWQEVDSPYRDIYGQQAIDTMFMILTYNAIYEYTHDAELILRIKDWMDWFYGNNIWKESMIKDNACCDGLDETGLSKNFGAESTIVYLWSKYIFDTNYLN